MLSESQDMIQEQQDWGSGLVAMGWTVCVYLEGCRGMTGG